MRTKLLLAVLVLVLKASAQDFFNLTAEEVRIDSVLPVFSFMQPLGPDYADSVYVVTLDYPEFIDMQPADIEKLHQISDDTLPDMPVVDYYVGTSRRQGILYASFVPLVFRDGKYQKLVSFKITVEAQPVARSRTRAAETESRYARHSVLASGSWAKISVPKTGIYQLTDALVRQAGFSNPKKVKVYGYGGALQPEVLNGDYLTATDDLKEVPTCTIGGRRLFHATGPVTWNSNTATVRTRNPYADYGCYFLTESDDEPLTQDSAAFVASFYPDASDYHSLHEIDNYAWYHSGRNLYEQAWQKDADNTYQLTANGTDGQLTVVLTFNGPCTVAVTLNDSLVGTVTANNKLPSNTSAMVSTNTFRVDHLKPANRVALRQTSGDVEIHLDYIALTETTPAPLPKWESASFDSPSFVYRITNQDHHADAQADMVIIIPTNQKQREQAERLKTLHESEGLRVNIVPADELYNEFSSGTPDANAFRRYLKMLYDRADSKADMPRYLLLFGDGAWDNRMVLSDWSSTSPDDFLLCYESENSLSATDSYVTDDFYCVLDDGEGGAIPSFSRTSDLVDVGVGRLSARDAAEAKIMVDKIIDYSANAHAGSWQNTLCFIGDDGNLNVHMNESNSAAKLVEKNYPGFFVKRIFLDAYTAETSSKGKSYPSVNTLIHQQMQNGALIMDYCGHGSNYCLAHEQVVIRNDFNLNSNLRLPLWITASCDVMPYDTQEENNGETAMLNPTGGCIAFFGTTRTVYTGANKDVNTSFVNHVLGSTDGERNRLGDAVRLCKNSITSEYTYKPYNKLHYTLLGDPALTLASPTATMVIDSIGGQSLDHGVVQLSAGEEISVIGHVEHADNFSGIMSMTIRDVEESITCKLNTIENADLDSAYVFTDRPNVIYQCVDSVVNGQFSVRFVLPRDISYSEATDLMTLYAVSADKTMMAHGENDGFSFSKGAEVVNDGVGPSIYCYLNSPSFTNGGQVNTTPWFYAELTDNDGINASGGGIGHDLQLIIDDSPTMTYNLNDYFQYDFGNYHSGSVGFSLPELTEGDHTLLFRAWDVLNNSSVAELKFQVVRGLNPQCFSIDCTRNPATTSTTFIVNHDRIGSTMLVELEIFDSSGRKLWHHAENGVSTDSAYTIDWDLTVDGGCHLQTGVYLYRVLISTDGSKKASKAKKLIILNK